MLDAVSKVRKVFQTRKKSNLGSLEIVTESRHRLDAAKNSRLFFNLQDYPDYFFFEFGIPFSLCPSNSAWTHYFFCRFRSLSNAKSVFFTLLLIFGLGKVSFPAVLGRKSKDFSTLGLESLLSEGKNQKKSKRSSSSTDFAYFAPRFIFRPIFAPLWSSVRQFVFSGAWVPENWLHL